MQSPNQFIVTPANNRRYDNVKKIEGLEIILDASEESASFSNREAVSSSVLYVVFLVSSFSSLIFFCFAVLFLMVTSL